MYKATGTYNFCADNVDTIECMYIIILWNTSVNTHWRFTFLCLICLNNKRCVLQSSRFDNETFLYNFGHVEIKSCGRHYHIFPNERPTYLCLTLTAFLVGSAICTFYNVLLSWLAFLLPFQFDLFIYLVLHCSIKFCYSLVDNYVI